MAHNALALFKSQIVGHSRHHGAAFARPFSKQAGQSAQPGLAEYYPEYLMSFLAQLIDQSTKQIRFSQNAFYLTIGAQNGQTPDSIIHHLFGCL